MIKVINESAKLYYIIHGVAIYKFGNSNGFTTYFSNLNPIGPDITEATHYEFIEQAEQIITKLKKISKKNVYPYNLRDLSIIKIMR